MSKSPHVTEPPGPLPAGPFTDRDHVLRDSPVCQDLSATVQGLEDGGLSPADRGQMAEDLAAELRVLNLVDTLNKCGVSFLEDASVSVYERGALRRVFSAMPIADVAVLLDVLRRVHAAGRAAWRPVLAQAFANGDQEETPDGGTGSEADAERWAGPRESRHLQHLRQRGHELEPGGVVLDGHPVLGRPERGTGRDAARRHRAGEGLHTQEGVLRVANPEIVS
ncbi:hypothetical protein [Actinomadura harenae]|uniref:hypothetical protein n=1 Tax=Actinomadura harenae TaxID=2483351 RepID=UPI00131511BA|nr:hypothetical protein [Actinomadura harenae]